MSDAALPLKILGNCSSPHKILFLHGGPGMDASYFPPYFKALSKKAELVFYTQGFSGESDIDGLISEMDAIVSSYAPQKIFLFGHSFGASLALEYIARRGEKNLAGLILCAWIYNKKIWLKDFAPRARKNPVLYKMDDYSTAEEFCSSVVKITPVYFSNSYLAVGRRLLKNIRYNLSLSRDLTKNFYDDFDGSMLLKKIRLPILSLAGVKDRIVSVETVRKGVALNRRIQAHEFTRAGHFPFVEQTRRVNETVLKFILNTPLL